MAMLFEWDDRNDRTNQRKHSLAFADVVSIFDDSRMLSLFDGDHSVDEERWISVGLSAFGLICVVVHTFRIVDGEERIRFISARPATKHEELQYYSG
jgi:uncharacterized protein